MRLVVADTGPLNYLVLIDAITVLPALFERISVPEAVRDELLAPRAPPPVRTWALQSPSWLEVLPNPRMPAEPSEQKLDPGERAALALARALGAELVLIDDRAGVVAAHRAGLDVVGTLGVLGLAARKELIDIVVAVAKLKRTNFRYRPEIIDLLLANHRDKSK